MELIEELHSVNIPVIRAAEALLWAHEHAPSYVRNSLPAGAFNVNVRNAQVTFFFERSCDAILFALRWSS